MWHPKAPPPLFWLRLFLLAAAISATSAAANARSSYIVFTSPAHMPPDFLRPSDWYASAIASAATTSIGGAASRISHRYRSAFHGFAASLTAAEARSLALAPGFLAVIPDRIYTPQTTYTPRYMGLTEEDDDEKNGAGAGGANANLWNRSAYGDGVIVGVLDTGIWPESRSFSDDGLGPVPSKWRGACVDAPGFNSSLCNRKLVGAKFYRSSAAGNSERTAAGKPPKTSSMETEPSSPRDTEGHGTHTASTIAGSFVKGASFFGYAAGTASGIAPRARLAAYKVCWETIGGCRSSDILAAMEDSIDDGVHVLSISLGDSEPIPFFRDPVAIAAFFAVCYHNIIVVCSAGNSGPAPDSVINGAPWILTVGASSVDRDFPASIVVDDSHSFPGQSLFAAAPRHHSDSNPVPSLRPLRFLSGGCGDGSALNTQNVTGAIVVCRQNEREEGVGSSAVAEAGGVGQILVQRADLRGTVLPTSFMLPGFSMSAAEGSALEKYGNNGGAAAAGTMAINGTRFGAKAAPGVTSFSARGPNAMAAEVMKPDVVAPGLGILAAWSGAAAPTKDPADKRRTEFNIVSGTSMSCPHAAGVVALLRALHPEWSMASIKSAMMTTARVTDGRGRPIADEADSGGGGATAWGYGAGEIDANAAADPGLVYNISARGYMDFLCSASLGYPREYLRVFGEGRKWRCAAAAGDEEDLNYPAITVLLNTSGDRGGSDGCGSNVTVQRRLENVDSGGSPALYSVNITEPWGVSVIVSPTHLNFSGSLGQELSFNVTLSATCHNVSSQDASFGWLTWQDSPRGAASSHSVRSPLVVIWDGDVSA